MTTLTLEIAVLMGGPSAEAEVSRVSAGEVASGLTEAGQRVTLLDPASLGFGLTVFAMVRTNQHSDEWYENFSRAVASIPEILEFHRTSGELDYLLRIVARDMQDYDRIYRNLIRQVDLADVSSTFVMETIKSGTGLPL